MNAATQTVTPSATIVALETLTVGQPVRVTLTSGRVIKGYVFSADTLTVTGFHAVIDAGGSAFLLHHYFNTSTNSLSSSVGCTRSARRISNLGNVASIESLV